METEHTLSHLQPAAQTQTGSPQTKPVNTPPQQGQTNQTPPPQKPRERKRETPDKWRKKDQKIADALARVQRLREQERKERSSRLIQAGLLFISLLSKSSDERRNILYSIVVPDNDTADAARMHDVFCWAEEQALKKLNN